VPPLDINVCIIEVSGFSRKLIVETPLRMELFQTFSDAQGKLSLVSIADVFVDGSCLGMMIANEAMQKRY
jgi:hypothetical protein